MDIKSKQCEVTLLGMAQAYVEMRNEMEKERAEAKVLHERWTISHRVIKRINEEVSSAEDIIQLKESIEDIGNHYFNTLYKEGIK